MKLKEGFALKKVSGNYILFPVDESTVDLYGMLGLNETGAFIWEKLANGATKSEVCNALSLEYEISTDTANADVDEFINKLADAGYIELN